MKLSGLFLIALIISLNAFSFDDNKERLPVTNDAYISLNKAFEDIHKESIWRSDFSDVTNWDSQNFLLINTEEIETLTIGNEKISFKKNNRYNKISNKCVVSTDFDANEDLKSQLFLIEPINISGYKDIDLRFSQIYRPIKGSNTFVEFSTNGESWTRIQINKRIEENMEVSNNVIVNISFLTENKENLWIRFSTASNDLSWIIDNVELQGLTTLLPEIITVTPDQGNQGETLSVGLSGQFTHFFQGSETVWFEQASQTIFSGNNILVSSLTQMNFNIDIPYSAPTGLYDVKVQNLTDGTITKVDGFEVTPAPSPGWSFTNTGLFHSILIPSYATITIDGLPITQGDYIGVFYDSLGTPACAGFELWTNNSVFLNVAADDPFTAEKDGFSIAEEFMWKIWDASTSTEYIASASYQLSGFPNTSLFAISGSSGISSIQAFSFETQSIALGQGWDIYSTYINPTNPTMESVFSSVIANVLIIKNGNGLVYWPPYINQIGSIAMGEGYQVNMAVSDLLEISGSAVVPELTPISIPNGWSILGYLRNSPASAVTMLSSIVNDIVIVKDGWGAVYWPVWGVNNIGNLVPGGGYQINLSNGATLTYPANSQSSKSGEFYTSYELSHYTYPKNTGSNMTLGIPVSSWETLPVLGDEVAVFNSKGIIVGCAVFENDNMAISIWGDDDFTKEKSEYLSPDESFELRIYNNSTGIESRMIINSWIMGSSNYIKDGISVVGNISVQNEIFELTNSPNPCSDFTSISFELITKTHVSINIFNSIGELVKTVSNSKLNEGIHNINVDVAELESGIYFYKFSTKDIEVSRQLLIVK